MTGSFDGQFFHADGEAVAAKFGNTGYAAQTYSNAPKGRVIQIAWLTFELPELCLEPADGIPERADSSVHTDRAEAIS